jgi:condensin complex subunit 2
MEFLVDPLFKKTSAAFDHGGAKGLLLNHLGVQNGCVLVFDSSDAVDLPDTNTADSNPDIILDELKGIWKK